jgi:tetratricopeptide (TPR) repeat protein
LEMAISLVKKAKQKVRLSYILAQLYSRENNQTKAAELYAYVAKKALTYEMVFNAQLNLALNLNSKDKGKIISVLNKMLKDKKNKDFQDQIYFVMAQVYEKNGDMENAVVNYKKSAASSINNPKQKALSYLAIADYYFKIPKYIEAQAFYDSSLVSLPETHLNYEGILSKAKNLSELVNQINIVQKEDSLQRIASMSESDRQKVIDAQIKFIEQKEELLVLEEKAKLEKIKAAAINQTNTGGWIFDNPNLLASANAEFVGIYGNRKLEDNWRRSNKASSVNFDVQDVASKNMDEYGNEKIAENKTSDYYLKDLPFTKEAVIASNEKIKKALYEIAIIFKDKLNDLPKSNEYFEELNRRFPDNENRVVSLYQLYRNYENNNNTEKAEINKNLILSDYPNSEYAQLIKNPNKGAEEEILKAQMNEYYQKILSSYQAGNYQNVVSEIEAVNRQFNNNPLKGNYDLLNAFAIGKIQGKTAFEIELKKVYSNHIGTAIGDDVKAILDQIESERMSNANKEKQLEATQRNFKFDKNEAHQYVLIYNSEIVNSEELMKKINTFKDQYFSSDSLQFMVETWSDKEKILTISSFKLLSTAQQFDKKVQTDIWNNIPNIGQLHFIISESNFQKLYLFKEVEKYLQFNKENYQ